MKYTENGIQYHVGLKEGDIGKYVILTGDPKRCKVIANRLENPVFISDSREFVTYTGTLKGEPVSVTSTGIGGPSAAIAIQELSNIGADTFVRVGTCGAMQTDIMSGDLIIATAAIRAEGTSREYAPIEYPAVADFQISSHLTKAAENLNFKHHIGVVHCKDSFYGQHSPELMPVDFELQNKWNAWIKMGCLASEMETAALFTVAQYLKVKIGCVLLVMANQEREKAGLVNPVAHNIDDAIITAVEAVKDIIQENKSTNNIND